MKQLFLSPRSNETAYKNFKSSLAEGRPVSQILPYLSDAQREIVKNQENVYIWGAQKSKQDTWEKLEIGDYVLFYSHGIYVQASELQLGLISDELAQELWPNSEDTGEPWSCIYIVKNLRNINLPIEEFNKYVKYEMPYLRGFQRVSDGHLENLTHLFGSLDNFIENITVGLKDYEIGELNKITLKDSESLNSNEIEKIDSIFGDRDPDDVIAELSARNLDKTPGEKEEQHKRIVRDYQLVKALKEKYENKCQICQFTFKMRNGGSYSEAAHIKAISTREKGIDVASNLLILCPNHHKMLDYGAIKVISNRELEIDGKKINLTS